MNYFDDKLKIDEIELCHGKIPTNLVFSYGRVDYFPFLIAKIKCNGITGLGESLPQQFDFAERISYDLIGKKMGDYVKQKNLIREELIRNYNEWGTTDYYVADETINDSEEKIDMLLDAVSNLPFKPTFGGFL